MNTPKQGFFESDDDYRDRVASEADERTIEHTTGEAPHQGFFESDNDYDDRISLEADEGTIEDTTGDAPHQGFFESDPDYRDRASLEAAEDTVEDLTGDAPHQGFFESDDDYRERVFLEADEATIENASGEAPHQGFFESDDDYRERISLEADEHRASSDDNSSGGCFITTACVEFAGLPDNCRELTLLRQFRNTYMMALPNGPSLIAEYYSTAPAIVAAIAASQRKSAALRSAWAAVQKAVGAIEKGDYPAALTIYSLMFRRLKRAFLEGPHDLS